ncbi:hypothetical protein [Phenylobacterium ferrooxidans]|uniref:SIR2-like domain-containing protein n=1 Tax=Phenylobacterium ferrooxidans TaxID=2982689 RepID=A0ABW6CTP8_9CAUL
MQFLDNGPDIPTELLEAQERGAVVFVCGAGVSRGVGLPSFHGLVAAVYIALGETWNGQPAEAPWIEGPAPALDRALFALQTRMGGADARMAANARSRILNAVQDELTAPPRIPLPDHLNLLRLSRDADMRPRLITTNFDVLFEQAWRESRGFPLPSRAVADMPGPGSADFSGVLHLHGRLAHIDLAALQNEAIDRVTAEELQFALGRAQVPDDLARAWRLLLGNRTAKQTQWDDGWFDIRRRLAGGDAGFDLRRQVARLFTPRPQARPVFKWPEEVEAEREARLMDVRYGGPVHADPAELLGLWPPAEDAALLRTLIRALEDALEEATDHGFTGQGFDRASFQVKSVAPHAQDSLREGFYPIVRVVADLLERLAAASPYAARAAAEQLAGQSYSLSLRLYLHALTLPGLFDPRWAAEYLLALNDEHFWVSDLRREVMRLAALRWAEFDPADRLALETRMAAGPPRVLFVEDLGMEEQVAGVMERETFLRLARQEHIAPGLGPAAAARLTAFRGANPKWELEVDERADFSSWSETRPGAQGEPELLDDVAADELVARAGALAAEDPWRQGEIWRKFVAADPVRAFEGLAARSEAGEWPSAAWIPFFWALHELDDPDLERRVVAALADAGVGELSGFATSVSSWMVRRAGLPAVAPEDRIALWDRLLDVLVADPREDDGGTDRASDILNRAPGHLARLLVHEIGQLGVDDGVGVPIAFKQRLDRLVDLAGARGAIAVAALGRTLPMLHRLDPDWAEARLVPFFAIDHDWAPAIWAQFATVGRWRNALFAVLRPAFLGAFGAPRRFEAASENLVFHLLRMARDRVAGEAEDAWPSFAETKAALAATNAEWRRHASFQLFREIEDTDRDSRALHWRETLGPLFVAVWPMAPALQSAESTYYLTGMMLRTGEAFPEAVTVVTPAVVGSGRDDRDALAMIRDDHQVLLMAHPRAGLELLDALVDSAYPPRDLGAWLDDLVSVEPALRTEMRFERLLGIARRAQA